MNVGVESDWSLFLLPIIGAAIGWITNFLAVWMLFHPRQEQRFLFMRFQGVLPKRQVDLARKLGAIVSKELFSAEDVKRVLRDNADSPRVLRVIEEQLQRTIVERLPEVLPLLTGLLNPVFTAHLKKALRERMGRLLTAIVDELGADLDQAFDVHAIVEERVSAFSSERIEELLLEIMRREFRFIEIIGAVLGFVIGLVQLVLIQ